MALLLDTVTGPLYQADGNADGPLRKGRMGSLVVTDAHGRYYESASRGSSYYVNIAAGAATAYAGAAAGTPLISLFNPLGSGKNLALLSANIGVHVGASGAGVAAFAIWAGVQGVVSTVAATNPINLLTLQSTGSVAKFWSNATLTNQTGTFLQILPLGAYYWASAAGAFLAPLNVDIAGAVVIAPGVFCALGGSAVLTSATYDVTLLWEEVPL